MFVGAQKNRLNEAVLFVYPQHLLRLRYKNTNFQLHTLIWRPDKLIFFIQVLLKVVANASRLLS